MGFLTIVVLFKTLCRLYNNVARYDNNLTFTIDSQEDRDACHDSSTWRRISRPIYLNNLTISTFFHKYCISLWMSCCKSKTVVQDSSDQVWKSLVIFYTFTLYSSCWKTRHLGYFTTLACTKHHRIFESNNLVSKFHWMDKHA